MKLQSVCHYTFSTAGGAGRVAKQLSSGLNNLGFDSYVKSLTDGDIKDCRWNRPILTGKALFDFFIVRKSLDQSLFTLYRESNGIPIAQKNSTIQHLHWMPGVATISVIGQLLRSERPTVWTLHDMWAFTGGCHHSMECDGYEDKCSQCPQIKRLFLHPVEQNLQSKRRSFNSNINFAGITPSNWLKKRAEQSEVFRGSKFTVIPNPIDTELFSPRPTRGNRDEVKLVIGCNATNLLDPMKGVKSLINALEKFQYQCPSIEVVLLAIGGGSISSQKIEIRQLGFLSDQHQIMLAYSQMDLFVSLSQAEVFPLSIAEAQSCGLPVICLDTGGMPEMIQQNVNGYVVKSSSDLVVALNKFIQPEISQEKMRAAARNHALENYSTEVVVNKYIDIYSSLISD